MDAAASSLRHASKDDGSSRHGAIRRLQVFVASLSLCRLLCCCCLRASCLALFCNCFVIGSPRLSLIFAFV